MEDYGKMIAELDKHIDFEDKCPFEGETPDEVRFFKLDGTPCELDD